MIPKVAFHTIASIELTPTRHFEASATCHDEFWSRELIIYGGDDALGDSEPYRLHLYSYESAAALEIRETRVVEVACLCGYVGPDVAHRPPDAKERLAELARRWGQEDPRDAT